MINAWASFDGDLENVVRLDLNTAPYPGCFINVKITYDAKLLTQEQVKEFEKVLWRVDKVFHLSKDFVFVMVSKDETR